MNIITNTSYGGFLLDAKNPRGELKSVQVSLKFYRARSRPLTGWPKAIGVQPCHRCEASRARLVAMHLKTIELIVVNSAIEIVLAQMPQCDQQRRAHR